MIDLNVQEPFEQLKHPHEKLLARQAIREFASHYHWGSEEEELMTVKELIIKIEDIIDLL